MVLHIREMQNPRGAARSLQAAYVPDRALDCARGGSSPAETKMTAYGLLRAGQRHPSRRKSFAFQPRCAAESRGMVETLSLNPNKADESNRALAGGAQATFAPERTHLAAPLSR